MYFRDEFGNLFFVDAAGTVFIWIEDGGGGFGGLGGFWSMVANIGAMASYAIPGAGAFIGPIATAAVGAATAASAQSAAEKEIGKQWEALVKDAVTLYGQIQAKANITASDVVAAEQAYAQMAQVAAQYSTIKYITDQWTSASYQPAFAARLADIQAKAAGAGVEQVAGAGAGAGGLSGITSSPFFLPAVIVGAVLFLKK